jgi:hypothetical protein
MKDPLEFYQQRLARFQEELTTVTHRSFLFAMLRLVVFVSIIFLLYFLNESNVAIVAVLIVGSTLFLFLVNRSSRARTRKNFLREIIKINEREVAYLNNDLSSFSKSEDLIDPDHPFGSDIDLYGDGSIFQHIDRTSLNSSKLRLSKMFNSNEIEGIVDRQQLIKELSNMPEWRQEFEYFDRFIYCFRMAAKL